MFDIIELRYVASLLSPFEWTDEEATRYAEKVSDSGSATPLPAASIATDEFEIVRQRLLAEPV